MGGEQCPECGVVNGRSYGCHGCTSEEPLYVSLPKKADMVNNPPHYSRNPAGIECIDVAEHMNFNIGNIVKYAWRLGKKGDPIEDLKKIIWYSNREIARLEKEK